MKSYVPFDELGEPYPCVCDECGRTFMSTEIYEGRYQEYAGACYQSYFVSPCCGSSFVEEE